MKIKNLILAATIALPVFVACDKDNNTDYNEFYPNALVTVKPIEGGLEIPGIKGSQEFYIQLTEDAALLPVNMTKSPSKLESRALTHIKEARLPQGADAEKFSKGAEIVWIDTILTKQPVQYDANVNIDEKYGEDPVKILRRWTVVEDGYITIEFAANWGYTGEKHEVNLILNANPADPYEVEFRHNAHGNTGYQEGSGIVAFSLKDLPDTKGETVKLKLKWKDFGVTKTVEFDYRTRPDWSQTE